MDEMSLVLAIVQGRDADDLLDGLVEDGFGATRVNSFGGFLRQGNAVVMVVAQNEQVDRVLEVIRRKCHTRIEHWWPLVGEPHLSTSTFEVEVGGAVVFALPIERFERLKGAKSAKSAAPAAKEETGR